MFYFIFSCLNSEYQKRDGEKLIHVTLYQNLESVFIKVQNS